MMMQKKLSSISRRLLLSCLVCVAILSQQQQHQHRAHASYLTLPTTAQQQQSVTSANLQQQQPSIIPFGFDQSVQEGQRVVVMCSTSSGESPVSFTWLKDGQILSHNARGVSISKPDQDSLMLKLRSVRLEHAGNYTCLAQNRFGSQQHSALLVVNAGPTWVKEPRNEPIVATRGQTVVIDCQTTGWPRPTQTWHMKTHNKADFEQLSDMRTATIGGGRISLAPNGSLVIRNADKSDEANYLCKSFNNIGPGISSLTPLKVTVPAHFETTGKQQSSIVRKGGQVQLRCDAFGDQPITIEWYKNKHPLAHSGTAAAAAEPGSSTADSRYSINTTQLKNGLISQLTIRSALRLDNSIYECVAKNHYGRDRLSNELVVQEEPDNIQELQVGQVDSRSVTLMWNEPYDGRSAISSYMFQYKRVQEAMPSQLMLNELDFVDSMQAESQQQQQQQQQAQMSAKMVASSLGGDWQHAQRIVMPLSNSTQAGGVRSITIDKLEPSSKYLLRALAINSIGQSKFSQPMEFSTDEEAPEVGPVNIRATAINSTSIHVSWDEIPRSKHPGRIHGYYVGYRVATNNSAALNFIHKPYIINDLVSPLPSVTAAGNGGSSIQPEVGLLSTVSRQQSGSDQSARLETVIQDLRRDTVYEITVLAFNRRGSGPSSDFVVCKTIEMEAPKAVKLSVSRELNESIYIEWQRDPTDQNPVDYYVLYQEKNSNSAEVRLPGNQTHYRAPGLKCGTRYQFYMIAHNKEGKSPPSEVVSASTSGALPVVPSKVSLIKWINNTCLLINLNSFQDNGCRINFFSVRYRVERQQQPQALSDGTIVGASSMAGSSGSANAQASLGGAQMSGSQLIGTNGLTASQQALTAAGHQSIGVGVGKPTLTGQANLANLPYTSEWTPIRPKGNMKQSRANEEDRMEYLCDLSPTGEYTIHVAAGNDVGRSEIEYTVLMSSDELRLSALKEMMELMSSLPNFIAYIPSILVFLFAALSLVIVGLILYTTAIKYYQKFVIMQNQMRATRRAKADEKRRRKLNQANTSASSRHSQKLADLWADEYEDGDMMDDDDDEDDDGGCGPGNMGAGDRERMVASSDDSVMDLGRGGDADGDDEDEATDEMQSNSSANLRVTGRVQGRGQRLVAGGKPTWTSSMRRHSTLQHKQSLMRPHHAHHYHQYSGSSPHGHHYLSNIANSVFDSSSIDSPCSNRSNGNNNNNNVSNGKPFSSGSTCSNESLHGRFQCLSSKQYVKMNEYSMLPTISASLSNPANETIYGTAPARPVQALAPQQPQSRHSSPSNAAQYRPINGTSPGANSSASNTTNSNTHSAASGNQHANPNSLYYSTLRRTTNMQTYLPQQQQQQQQQQRLQRRQSQNVADIYGYYMAPQVQAQAQAQAAAAAVAAQQAANEAANSIFVPPQQIIYSAPNVRRQPSVFV